MKQEELNFEKFLERLEGADTKYLAFVQSLHKYLLDNGCKVTFEEKKTSLFASYKHTKSKKSIANMFIKKQGLFVRIYGENTKGYTGFLETLPQEMVQSIDDANVCKRLVSNGCSPKCTGYDFSIGSKRFQKCKYGCFEFLAAKKTNPFIKSFIENEIKERAAI